MPDLPPHAATIFAEPFAGLQAQALGLAEAAGLHTATVDLVPRLPERLIPASLWPDPLRACHLPRSAEDVRVAITVGGVGGAIGAALRRGGARVVQIQNPRLPLTKFDLVIANQHDEIAGANVITVRTALHRATTARLLAARAIWAPRFAHLPRPLVGVLVGGSNGRFRLEAAQGETLARDLAGVLKWDHAGMAVTPSRRTAEPVRRALDRHLKPHGAWIWDMAGDNPYFGILACADTIIVTVDSISMVSEAVATHAPVLLAELPGKSRRIALFHRGLQEIGRVRPFAGRLAYWPVLPIDDTQAAAQEMLRRLAL
jgi:mitochondrial fission protein ELM1